MASQRQPLLSDVDRLPLALTAIIIRRWLSHVLVEQPAPVSVTDAWGFLTPYYPGLTERIPPAELSVVLQTTRTDRGMRTFVKDGLY